MQDWWVNVGKDTGLVGRCWEGYKIGGLMLGRIQDWWVSVGKIQDWRVSVGKIQDWRVSVGKIQDWRVSVGKAVGLMGQC
jgi:hypothetical protein